MRNIGERHFQATVTSRTGGGLTEKLKAMPEELEEQVEWGKVNNYVRVTVSVKMEYL